jgi:hypothetical protein
MNIPLISLKPDLGTRPNKINKIVVYTHLNLTQGTYLFLIYKYTKVYLKIQTFKIKSISSILLEYNPNFSLTLNGEDEMV